MTESEVFRIVAEVIGIVVALGAGIWRLLVFGRAVLKAVNALHERMDHLDECIDSTRTEIRNLTQTDIVELKRIGQERDVEYRDIKDELMYLKGRVGMPLDKPVGRDGIKEIELEEGTPI